MSQETVDVNPQDMIIEAERALSEGRFLKARSYTSKARGVMQRTLELHRNFMDTLKEFLERIDDMEEKGYDVTEARGIVEKAKTKAVKSRYEQAIKAVSMIEPALRRATYLPFPLLNKNVDIHSVINFTGGNLNYTVRIENPTTKPLGEIIIKPFLQDGMFQQVQERPFGVIEPLSYKESTFILTPKVKNWNIGVGREVIRGDGVIMRTRLSSREGQATYSITIENNSDQIIRDIIVAPMIPASMEPDPVQGIIEHVSPYGSETVDFKLTPASMDRWIEEEDNIVAIVRDVEAEEIIMDDEDGSGDPSDHLDSGFEDKDDLFDGDEEEEEDFDEPENPFIVAGDDEDDDEELFDDGSDISDDDLDMEISENAPADFTPVEAEYNLDHDGSFELSKKDKQDDEGEKEVEI